MKRIFFLVLTTLAFFYCKNEEKPRPQTLNCYVRYDDPTGTVKAEAILNDLESKKPVEIKGGIRYQGDDMKLLPAYGMTYQFDQPTRFLGEHVFEWKGAKDASNQFKMGIEPIKSFALALNPLVRNQLNTLTWEGAPMGKGETLVMMWENTEAGLTVPFEVATTSGQPLIDIPGEKLKEITAGNWTLYLVRKKLTKSTIGGIQVNGIMEYYTKTINVKVVEK